MEESSEVPKHDGPSAPPVIQAESASKAATTATAQTLAKEDHPGTHNNASDAPDAHSGPQVEAKHNHNEAGINQPQPAVIPNAEPEPERDSTQDDDEPKPIQSEPEADGLHDDGPVYAHPKQDVPEYSTSNKIVEEARPAVSEAGDRPSEHQSAAFEAADAAPTNASAVSAPAHASPGSSVQRHDLHSGPAESTVAPRPLPEEMTENPDDILKQDANNSDTVSGVELPEPSASPDAVANPAVEQPVHIGPQTSQTNETGPEEAALVTKVTESSNAVPAAIKETDHSAEVSVSPPADEISESAGPTLAADQPNPEHTPEPESVAVMSTPVDPAATTSPSETETSGSKVHHTYIKLAAEPDVHEADFEPVTVASAPEHSVTKAEEAATDLVGRADESFDIHESQGDSARAFDYPPVLPEIASDRDAALDSVIVQVEQQPAPHPTDEPTPQPTDEPTPQPTDEPTTHPTDETTPHPTAQDPDEPVVESKPALEHTHQSESGFAAEIEPSVASQPNEPTLSAPASDQPMNEQEHSLEVLQQAMNSEALVTLMNMTIGVMAAQPAASAALEAVIREEALSIETRSGRASFVDGESIAAEPEAPAHNNVESSEPEIKREQLDTEPSKPDHKADEPVEHSVPRESVHAVADSQQPEARPASVEAQSREIATEDADAIPTNVDAANAIENVSGDEVDPKLIEQQLAEHHETAKAVDAVVAQALEPAEPAHPEPAHPEPTQPEPKHPEPNQPVEAVATMEVNGAPTQSALLLTQETVVASSGQTNGELEPHQAQQAESTVLEAQKPDEAQVGPHPVEVIAHTIQPPPVLEQPANLPEPTKDETPAKAPESVQETETPVPQIAPVASVPSAAVVVAAPVPSHATNPPEALPQSIESKGPTASAKDKPGSAHAAHEDSKETHVSPSLGHALEQKSPSEAKMHLGESRTSSPKPSAIPELTVTIPTGETQVLTPPDTKKSKKGGILSPFKKLFKFFSKK